MLGKCSSISRVWQAWFVPRAPLWQGRKIAWQKLEFVTYVFFNFYFASHQGRIKGAQRGDCPGPPAAKGPPWWNLFVSNEILVSKIFVIQKRYKNTTLLYSYVLLSMKGTEQQLISLHQGGNLITTPGRMNCALSLAGRKINRFYPKIPPLSNYEEEWLLLNYYLSTCLSCSVLTRCCTMTWVTKVWIGPYQMFTRAAGSPPLLYMFDSLPVLVIATARPAQSIRPVRP